MPVTYQYITDHTLFEQAFKSWINTFAGINDTNKVFWADSKKSKPTPPYATMRIITPGLLEGIDHVYSKYNATTDFIDFIHSGPRRMTLECGIYTNQPTGIGQLVAGNITAGLVASVTSTPAMALFDAAGLSFSQQLSGIRTEGEQVGDIWEWKSFVDLEFGYISAFTEVSAVDDGTTWIETVETPSEDDGTLTIEV